MSRRHARPALAATAILAAALAAPAARAALDAEVTGAVNAAQDRTSSPEGQVSSSRVDVRPGAVLQLTSPRLVWRVGYLFSGSKTVDGDGGSSYSNALDLSLAAETSPRSTLGVTAAATQGTTYFRLSERAAAAGEPTLRPPEDLSLVTATLGEVFGWEASQRLRLEQLADVAVTAPQDELDRRNVVASASLRLERLFPRDALGVLSGARFGVLRPLVGEVRDASRTITASLLASWNHDFDPRWNAQATAGVEQVNRLGSDSPATYHPTGGLTIRYFKGEVDGALDYRHGATASLETGTLSLSDEVVARGIFGFGPARQLATSAGYRRSRPLAGVATASAEAASGDVGLVWSLSEGVLASARYSVSYQFGDALAAGTSWVHVALVGVTARWGTSPYIPPVPTLGEGRVDRGDTTGFPGEREDGEPAPAP